MDTNNQNPFIQKIPNILSLARIFLTPLIVVFMLMPTKSAHITALILYAIICISDNLDGYIARKYNCVSKIGALFDTIADKILIVIILFGLIAVNIVHGWLLLGAVLIILREVVLTAFRQFLSDYHISVATSFLGKVKATIQMVALGLLIAIMIMPSITSVAIITYWLAVAITLYSGYDYLYKGLKSYKKIKQENNG